MRWIQIKERADARAGLIWIGRGTCLVMRGSVKSVTDMICSPPVMTVMQLGRTTQETTPSALQSSPKENVCPTRPPKTSKRDTSPCASTTAGNRRGAAWLRRVQTKHVCSAHDSFLSPKARAVQIIFESLTR